MASGSSSKTKFTHQGEHFEMTKEGHEGMEAGPHSEVFSHRRRHRIPDPAGSRYGNATTSN
jgi:hypothetical protein